MCCLNGGGGGVDENIQGGCANCNGGRKRRRCAVQNICKVLNGGLGRGGIKEYSRELAKEVNNGGGVDLLSE